MLLNLNVLGEIGSDPGPEVIKSTLMVMPLVDHFNRLLQTTKWYWYSNWVPFYFQVISTESQISKQPRHSSSKLRSQRKVPNIDNQNWMKHQLLIFTHQWVHCFLKVWTTLKTSSFFFSRNKLFTVFSHNCFSFQIINYSLINYFK